MTPAIQPSSRPTGLPADVLDDALLDGLSVPLVQSWFAHARESARADVLAATARLRDSARSHQDAWELERFVSRKRSLESGMLGWFLDTHRAAHRDLTLPEDGFATTAALLRAFDAFYLGDLVLKQTPKTKPLPPLDAGFTLAAAARCGSVPQTGLLAEHVAFRDPASVDPRFAELIAAASTCALPVLAAVLKAAPDLSVADALTAALAAAA